ncbi:hypothetical protein JOE29_002880 [Pseudomonas sp. PvP009]|nr:hypothetical protein [Pseudomonas sp. PvP009]
MPCGTDDLVGASLLAKTVFQSMHFRRLCKLFREQARSHRYGVFSGDVKHSHRAGVFSSHVDYSHRSAVFRAMRMPCGTDDLVGASLLAKTVFQSMHFRRLCKLFREQARSHRYGVFSGDVKHSHRAGVFSSYVDYSHRSAVFRAMRMPCGTDDLVGASLLAKTVFQSMHFRRLCKLFREQAPTGTGCFQAMWITHTGRLCLEPCECHAALMTLWERACSRRRCFSRCIFGACANSFASKLAPTGTGCFQAMWITHTGRLCLEPCECPAALMTLWERACSRRRCFSRCIFGACANSFASKLAPTGTGCFRAM